MEMKPIVTVLAGLLTTWQAAAQYTPSTTDAWDTSQGSILVLNTPLDAALGSPKPYDGRDAFGGAFGDYQAERGNIVFTDGTPDGNVHIIAWRTRKAVTIKSFRLFAYDDPATQDHGLGTFRLKAKTVGSLTFDQLLFEFTPSHPFTYEDAANHLLIAANIKPIEAQEFRAEFTTWTGQSGLSANGPRIVELDGYTEFIGVRPEIRTSETEVSWATAPEEYYQVEYREKLSGSSWQKLGAPVVGNGAKISITDKLPPGSGERFYRVIPLE